MAGKARWTQGKLRNGVKEIYLSHWKWFSVYVNQELLDYTTYIYRGHGYSEWRLEPTLDRLIKTPASPKRKAHFENFRFSTRGRRGANPPVIEDENGWWALGQHHGLSTPLLDWTESPFVALYFAMVRARAEPGSNCCVWCLAESVIKVNNKNIESDSSVKPVGGRVPIVEIVRPLSDENNRLVNQRGLFTRGPNNIELERWVKMNNNDSRSWDLIKIVVPKKESEDCLRYLNRMNINHATLFPDLYGASEFCNMELSITRY